MEAIMPDLEVHGINNGHREASTGNGHVPADAAETNADLDSVVAIVEALLFAAGAPVPTGRLVQAIDGVERSTVVRALEALRRRLDGSGSGLRLVEVGGGHQLRTRPEHAPWVRRILGGRPPRLSRAMLETVAIIAYKQPCTRPEIEAIRGVDVDAVVSTLVERRLVRILGRKDAPGRPILYGTTPEFLEVFGLPDLGALPALRELGDVAEVLTAQELAIDADGVHAVDDRRGAGAEEEAAARVANAEHEGEPDGDSAAGE